MYEQKQNKIKQNKQEKANKQTNKHNKTKKNHQFNSPVLQSARPPCGCACQLHRSRQNH